MNRISVIFLSLLAECVTPSYVTTADLPTPIGGIEWDVSQQSVTPDSMAYTDTTALQCCSNIPNNTPADFLKTSDEYLIQEETLVLLKLIYKLTKENVPSALSSLSLLTKRHAKNNPEGFVFWIEKLREWQGYKSWSQKKEPHYFDLYQNTILEHLENNYDKRYHTVIFNLLFQYQLINIHAENVTSFKNKCTEKRVAFTKKEAVEIYAYKAEQKLRRKAAKAQQRLSEAEDKCRWEEGVARLSNYCRIL